MHTYMEAGFCQTHYELSRTFLCDADGSTAHAHSESIHTSVDQILRLRSRHDYRVREQNQSRT